MYDVFISYVLGNEEKVRRIYEDLTRSGIIVWEFRSVIRFDANFIEEFKYQICNSRVFCLIDSNEARKGEYVKMEVAHARKQHRNITICRIDELINEPPIFEGQEFIIRFNLWQKKYRSAIQELCEHLGKEYIPAFSEPIDEDFLEEMANIRMREQDMAPGEWKRLYNEYEEFRQEIETESAEYKLKVLLTNSRKFNVSLLTPYLVLGDLYAKQKAHLKAKEIYKEAIAKFSQDPRSYAGLGGACFFLAEFEESVTAYLACFDLLLHSDAASHQEHIVRIAHNLLQSMLECRIPVNFIDRVNKIAHKDLYPGQLYALKGKYFLYNGDYHDAIFFFEKAYTLLVKDVQKINAANANYLAVLILEMATAYGYLNQFKQREKRLKEGISLLENEWKHLIDVVLQQLLPEMMRLLGETYLNTDQDEEKAIFWYEKAAITGNSIKYYSELALVLSKFSSPRLAEILNKTEQYRPKKGNRTNEECYYTGLYYFLTGKVESAWQHYNDSDMYDWPFYDKL